MVRLILLILLAAGIAETATGQSLPFRSYSIEKGLSESVVNDMIQDEEGYLWIATGYGLNRFDGYNFENYYEEDGLNDNKTYSLYQEDEGRIWIGTGSGVNIFERDSIRTVTELAPLNNSTVLEIFKDNQGEYWFATDGEGVWHLDSGRNLTQYLTIHGLANDRVRDIVEDREGGLWFGTRGGLTTLNNGNFRTYTMEDGLPQNLIRDLLIGREGTLWIATRDGLSRKTGDTFINYTTEDGLVNNRVQSLSVDHENGLWIGTEEGASHFTGETFKNYSVWHGLSNNIIYSTLYDREGNIWFGTFGGGVNVFLGEHITNFTVDDGLPNNVITSITEDRAGNYWIATYGGGIARLQNDTFETYSENDGLVDNKVYTVNMDRQNRLLVGTRWGLSIYDGRYFRNFDETEVPYRKIRSIEEGMEDGEYWLGTYGEGVLKYKDGSFQTYSDEEGLGNNTVLSVKRADDGSLWLATYGGVSHLKDGEFTNYSIRDGLPNNGVLDILIDRKGDVWAATFGGIAKFNDGSFIPITVEDGLPNEVCYFILQDDIGNYWIGTKIGVVRFDYEEYLEERDDTDRSKAFKLFTRDQGLIANEMNAGAGFKDRRGNLWFGTVGGLSRLNPAKLRSNNVPPVVHIENVIVAGDPRKATGNIQVGSESNNIIIEYMGISFTAPEQVLYEYRLKGSGEEWQRTTQRSVRYSALLPGVYTFQVRARNSDGIWSEEVTSISFGVSAPFWLQWWFIALVIAVVLGIILFAYNYYRVRKMVEIERMRVRIASDLHDDVGSSLTEIALQSDFLQTSEVGSELKETLEHIGNQSRKIVSSLDDIVWSIDARNDTLGDLTDRMQDYINNVLPEREVTYEFGNLDMDDKLNVPLKENLYLIFKEAVSNISKHSDASKVVIKLANENGSFDLYIHDNGEGFKNGRKSGHGLRNMKMRAERIDADISFGNEDGFTVHVHGDGL